MLAISFVSNLIGMAVVAIVLEQLIHSRRKGTALKVAAALFVLTIFSIINAIHRFVEFAAFQELYRVNPPRRSRSGLP